MYLVAAVVIGTVIVSLWPDKHDRARWKYKRAMKALERATKKENDGRS
jgi:hypothetical protein